LRKTATAKTTGREHTKHKCVPVLLHRKEKLMFDHFGNVTGTNSPVEPQDLKAPKLAFVTSFVRDRYDPFSFARTRARIYRKTPDLDRKRQETQLDTFDGTTANTTTYKNPKNPENPIQPRFDQSRIIEKIINRLLKSYRTNCSLKTRQWM